MGVPVQKGPGGEGYLLVCSDRQGSYTVLLWLQHPCLRGMLSVGLVLGFGLEMEQKETLGNAEREVLSHLL